MDLTAFLRFLFGKALWESDDADGRHVRKDTVGLALTVVVMAPLLLGYFVLTAPGQLLAAYKPHAAYHRLKPCAADTGGDCLITEAAVIRGIAGERNKRFRMIVSGLELETADKKTRILNIPQGEPGVLYGFSEGKGVTLQRVGNECMAISNAKHDVLLASNNPDRVWQETRDWYGKWLVGLVAVWLFSWALVRARWRRHVMMDLLELV